MPEKYSENRRAALCRLLLTGLKKLAKYAFLYIGFQKLSYALVVYQSKAVS